MKRAQNTLEKGSVRYIVFRDGDAWYSVGLEFNIVETGDTPQEALLLLFEALEGYVEAAKKMKARPKILNQEASSEYEKMWKQLVEGKAIKGIEVFTKGDFVVPTKKHRQASALSLVHA